MMKTAAQERQELRRSLSLPAAAKKTKLATQAYLRCTEQGDVEGLRKMALRMGAEMSGLRALDRFGNDPVTLLASSGHLTIQEQNRVREQFVELPQLITAVGKARGAREAATFKTTKAQKGWDRTSLDGTSKPSTPPDQTFAPSSTSRLGTRLQSTLAGLVSTMDLTELVCEAAMTHPAVIKEPPKASSQSLPALAAVLKSEELAVGAVKLNPDLLRKDAQVIRKMVPPVTATLGSNEESAYAIATSPGLLEVPRPNQIKFAVQAVASCVYSMAEAIWLIIQTVVPPSIKVVARQFCREEAVGEFFVLEGAEAYNRPVYKKPASAMKHLGPKAKDVFLVYSNSISPVPVEGSAGGLWIITSNSSACSSRPGMSKAPLPLAEEGVIGWACSERNSPDQVPPATWFFRHERLGHWVQDRYVEVLDGGQARAPSLMTREPDRLRACFNMIRESLGIVWRQALPDGAPDEEVCAFIGSADKEMALHMGGEATFAQMASFAAGNRYVYLQLPHAVLEGETMQKVQLRTWEPIIFSLLYCGPAPPADGEEQDQEPPPEDPDNPAWPHLKENGFRKVPPHELPALPALKGLPELSELHTRCYQTGSFEVSIPPGPGGIPPLVFIRSQICGLNWAGLPYHTVKAKDPISAPFLVSAGELGYTGFFVFAPPGDVRCEETENIITVDTADPIQVVVAFFHLPPWGGDVDEQGSPVFLSEGEEPCTGEPANPAPPPLPEWVNTWEPYDSRIPLRLKLETGHEAKAFRLISTEIQHGMLAVPGTGQEIGQIVFWRPRADPRPDPLRTFLRHNPNLLSHQDEVALLLRELRYELGDDRARAVLAATAALGGAPFSPKLLDWPKLCQAGDSEAIKAWVFEHKVEALAEQLKNDPKRARGLLLWKGYDGPLDVRVPDLEERCEVLREVLGGGEDALVNALDKQPDLLAATPAVLRDGLAALELLVVQAAAQAAARMRPKLLLQGEATRIVLAEVEKQYPEIFRERLGSRRAGEWPHWPELVGTDPQSIAAWLGRIASEEREAVSADRVRLFGASGMSAGK